MTAAFVSTGLRYLAPFMDEPFDLPVIYKDKELAFRSRLLQTGYTHKFEVDVYGTAVLFEPDEEGRYRALVAPDDIQNNIGGVELLEAIATGIENVLK